MDTDEEDSTRPPTQQEINSYYINEWLYEYPDIYDHISSTFIDLNNTFPYLFRNKIEKFIDFIIEQKTDIPLKKVYIDRDLYHSFNTEYFDTFETIRFKINTIMAIPLQKIILFLYTLHHN